MKNSIILIALLVAATVAFAEGKPQTTCPVMGGPVDKSISVDADGYRIYVCCQGCVNAVKADPEKYIQQMKAEGIEIEKAPAAEVEKVPAVKSHGSGMKHEGSGMKNGEHPR